MADTLAKRVEAGVAKVAEPVAVVPAPTEQPVSLKPMDGYEMPSVKVGEIVNYYGYEGERDPMAAIVTKVGGRSVSVTLFPPDYRGVEIKDGVRHVTDPIYKRQKEGSGAWGLR